MCSLKANSSLCSFSNYFFFSVSSPPRVDCDFEIDGGYENCFDDNAPYMFLLYFFLSLLLQQLLTSKANSSSLHKVKIKLA